MPLQQNKGFFHWAKQHTIYAVIIGGIVTVVAVSLFWGEKPVQQVRKNKAQASVMPDVGIQSGMSAKSIRESQGLVGEVLEQNKDLQKQIKKLESMVSGTAAGALTTNKDLQKQIKKLESKQAADVEERKKERLEDKQAREALLAQLKAMAEKQAKAPKTTVITTETRKVLPKQDRTAQQTTHLPDHQDLQGQGKCRVGALCVFDVPQPGGLFRQPRPPSIEQTPYLPKLSYARVRVVGGLMAKAQDGAGYPALLSVIGPFYGPMHLHGPGRRPSLTEVPMQGCLVLGIAKADLSMGRAKTEATDLSCVMPDAHAFDPEIKGFVLGDDGTFGFPGDVIRNSSAAEYKAILSAILQEVSGAIQAARSTFLVTGTGGIQPGQGMQNGINQLVQFYLQQTYQLQPVIGVRSMTEGTLILQQGLELEGYPTEALILRGDM